MWAISGCLATARVLLEKTKQELPRVFDELIERCGNWLEATDFDDAGDPLNDRGRPGQQQFEILRDNYLEVSAHLNTSEYILSNLEEEQHVIDLWEAAFAWYEINQASRYIEALSRDIRRLVSNERLVTAKGETDLHAQVMHKPFPTLPNPCYMSLGDWRTD